MEANNGCSRWIFPPHPYPIIFPPFFFNSPTGTNDACNPPMVQFNAASQWIAGFLLREINWRKKGDKFAQCSLLYNIIEKSIMCLQCACGFCRRHPVPVCRPVSSENRGSLLNKATSSFTYNFYICNSVAMTSLTSQVFEARICFISLSRNVILAFISDSAAWW